MSARNRRARELVGFAVLYVHEMNEELRLSHFTPRTQRIEPPEVAAEYERVSEWLKGAHTWLVATAPKRTRRRRGRAKKARKPK